MQEHCGGQALMGQMHTTEISEQQLPPTRLTSNNGIYIGTPSSTSSSHPLDDQDRDTNEHRTGSFVPPKSISEYETIVENFTPANLANVFSHLHQITGFHEQQPPHSHEVGFFNLRQPAVPGQIEHIPGLEKRHKLRLRRGLRFTEAATRLARQVLPNDGSSRA